MEFMRRVYSTLLMVCLFCISMASSYAQVTTATIVGHVTDSSGGAVPKASVITTNLDTGDARTAVANSSGEFRAEFLPAGNYSVQISASGYKTYVQTGITLSVGQIATTNVALTVGETTESVTVTNDLPLVNTSNGEIASTISEREIVDLPLVDRNPYTLLDIVPGVQSNQNSIVLGYPEQRTIINGGSDAGTGSVNYFLDGAPNLTGLRNTGNILPNPDALAEFRVQTNGYSAEFGRFPNGIVNAVTRSGTNKFHGSLFEFYRNDALAAKQWGSSGLATAPLNRHQFGGAIGGPIRKDRTFFFGSYAGLRQTTSTLMNTAVVPTEAERAGDFSADPAASQPVDPLTKQVFVCNGRTGVICANRIDQVASTIINRYIPTLPAGQTVWKGFVSVPYVSDEFLAKVDEQLTPMQRLSVMYFNTSGHSAAVANASATNLPWSQTAYIWRQQNAIINHTWTITPTLVNQAWVSYTRNLGARVNTPQTSLGDLGSTFAIQGPKALPQITVTNFFTLGNAVAGPKAGTNFYALRDLVSFTHGKHSLRFGGELSLDKDEQAVTQANYGTFSFGGTVTSATIAGVKHSNAFADFLIGIPSSVAQASPVTGSTNSWNASLFLQDDWRVLPRLTLNLGLRWDVQTPPTDPENKETTYVAGRQSSVYTAAPVGQLFPGDAGVTRGIIPVRIGHLSPRFGFAFDPTGKGTTAIRAAAGIFWGSMSGNEWNTMENFQPYSLNFTFTNAATTTGATLSDPYRNLTGGNPFPFSRGWVTGASMTGVALGYNAPYTIALNASVQQQMTKTLGLQVAYVGSLGHDLPFATDVNYPVPSATATNASANVLARRPNPKFGQIALINSDQRSNYHSLQASVNQRLAFGLQFSGYYIWSKSISSVDLQQAVANSGAQDYSKLSAERGLTSNDTRNSVAISLIWDPHVRAADRFVRATVNGWRVSAITKLRSGQPFTILNGVDANLDGSSSYDRAQLVGDPHVDRPLPSRWFNTAAFAQNAVTTGKPVDGSSPRNFLEGPAFRDVDMSLVRSFPLLRKTRLEVRGDATNILNIASYSTPSQNGRTVSSSLFGQISTANTVRTLQVGAKLLF